MADATLMIPCTSHWREQLNGEEGSKDQLHLQPIRDELSLITDTQYDSGVIFLNRDTATTLRDYLSGWLQPSETPDESDVVPEGDGGFTGVAA